MDVGALRRFDDLLLRIVLIIERDIIRYRIIEKKSFLWDVADGASPAPKRDRSYVLSIRKDGALGGFDEMQDKVGHCRFADAGRPRDGDDLSACDDEADVFQDALAIRVRERYVLELYVLLY